MTVAVRYAMKGVTAAESVLRERSMQGGHRQEVDRLLYSWSSGDGRAASSFSRVFPGR